MGSCQSKTSSDAVLAAGVGKDQTEYSTSAAGDDNMSTEADRGTTSQRGNDISSSYETSSLKINENGTNASMGDTASILSSAFPFPIFSESIDNDSEYHKSTVDTDSKDQSTFSSTVNLSNDRGTNSDSKDESRGTSSEDSKDFTRATYPSSDQSSEDTRGKKYMYCISEEASEDTSIGTMDHTTIEKFNHEKFKREMESDNVIDHMFCMNKLTSVYEMVVNCGSTNDVQDGGDFVKNETKENYEDVVVEDTPPVATKPVTKQRILPALSPTVTQGVHYSVLKEVLENHLPSCKSLDRDTATTSEVIAEVVKKHPKLSEMKVSWIEMLQQQNACGNDGVPLAGPATAMISHTWRYNFAEVAETIIQYAEEYEKKIGRPFYIWMDMFILNQFATESFDPNWLKETFTNVIKDIGLTISIMTPIDDPASIRRVWCLWEVYLSRRFAKLHIALTPDQKKRFEDALLMDPYLITSMLEKIDSIDAQNAEAFDPKDKDMIFEAIRSSIGFDELNATVIGALREWIESQCQEKIKAIEDGTLDASEALAAPTNHSGRGSTLFRAISLRSVGLARLSLLHPDVAKVINGTSDSWPPFQNALTSGLCDIADAILDHPAYDFSSIGWQIDSYMITEKEDHRYHPDFDTNVPQSRVEQTLRKFFAMRAAAGFPEPSYEEFVDMSVKGTLPSKWCY